MGPILIFDKSALQVLTVDESVWLDTHYLINVTPLFFVEMLADLSKEMKEGQSPEQFVGRLAEKTPTGGRPNLHHRTLVEAELMGNGIEMSRRPIVGGGRNVSANGRTGIIFEEPPENEALQRWEHKEFLDVERRFARQWRESLSNIDLESLFQEGRGIIKRHRRPKDLAEVKQLAVELLEKPGSRYAREAIRRLSTPRLEKMIYARWEAKGQLPPSTYAPYTSHVMTVDLFFTIALGADLVGRERASNKIDLAYLYYLPFCMVFTSRDKLHKRAAPLFLGEDQLFIDGDELKEDLAKLDAHYSSLPQETKDRGVMSFAHFPPKSKEFLTTRVWDELMSPTWRDDGRTPPRSPEKEKELLGHLKKIKDAPKGPDTHSVNSDKVDYLLVKRVVPIFKGKWRIVPPEAEKPQS